VAERVENFDPLELLPPSRELLGRESHCVAGALRLGQEDLVGAGRAEEIGAIAVYVRAGLHRDAAKRGQGAVISHRVEVGDVVDAQVFAEEPSAERLSELVRFVAFERLVEAGPLA